MYPKAVRSVMDGLRDCGYELETVSKRSLLDTLCILGIRDCSWDIYRRNPDFDPMLSSVRPARFHVGELRFDKKRVGNEKGGRELYLVDPFLRSFDFEPEKEVSALEAMAKKHGICVAYRICGFIPLTLEEAYMEE